ncbi:hypothetical protein H257_03302 [Aphanomyces astaci]|uniref:Uncharacterized protein n=1 Tax=Aphanomyces astaci TaxID=112090 RepID=W4H206_APHAT|nr:hypothetical protein H257_03302 [Aphanomyces astaci]ETV85596.1 hypothetical protein H257_03302 [Aphanomyces astaci]|eukprot:XP_009825614.1 hypothetical protein H257_03302 [Aphanomyces astaci]
MLGSNNYKLPHLRKDASIDDLLSYNVECNATCVTSALVHMDLRLVEEARMEEECNSTEQDILPSFKDCSERHGSGFAVLELAGYTFVFGDPVRVTKDARLLPDEFSGDADAQFLTA